MKPDELKSLIKEVIRERCGGGHLAGGEKGKRMFKHIKTGYKGEKSPEDAKRIAAATVNKNLGEAGLTSDEGTDHDYSESEEFRLIKGLNLITKKLLSLHKGTGEMDEKKIDVDWDQESEKKQPVDVKKKEPKTSGEEKSVNEAGPQYKVVDGRSYTERPGEINRAREIQENPTVNEAGPQHKKVSPRQARIQKDDHARRVQSVPTVTESNPKVQHRSHKTINDVDQNPENVRDPEVPQA